MDECKRNPDPALHISNRRIATERYQLPPAVLQYKRKNEVHQGFGRKQAVIDIEGQLTGSIVPTSEVSQAKNGMPPAQIRLVKALQAVPTGYRMDIVGRVAATQHGREAIDS